MNDETAILDMKKLPNCLQIEQYRKGFALV
jgi:hypothetical protein